MRGIVPSPTLVARVQLGGAAVGGAAGLAGAAAVNSKPGTPGALAPPLDPGVTRPDSNTRSDTNGQTAAQIAAANPAGNVFVQNTPTAARNPGELHPRSHGLHDCMRTPTCILQQVVRDHKHFGRMICLAIYVSALTLHSCGAHQRLMHFQIRHQMERSVKGPTPSDSSG